MNDMQYVWHAEIDDVEGGSSSIGVFAEFLDAIATTKAYLEFWIEFEDDELPLNLNFDNVTTPIETYFRAGGMFYPEPLTQFRATLRGGDILIVLSREPIRGAVTQPFRSSKAT